MEFGVLDYLIEQHAPSEDEQNKLRNMTKEEYLRHKCEYLNSKTKEGVFVVVEKLGDYYIEYREK